MDPLANFKLEIQAMFQQSFKELSQKNNLNRTILSNLIDAAEEQSQRINQLDGKIQNLKKMANPDVGLMKNQIQNQEKIIHDNFDKMMYRLSQIQEGISHSRKNLQHNMNLNRQSEESMNQLLRQLEKIQKQQRLPEYKGTKDQLYQEIQEFQRIIQSENERIKYNSQSMEMSKKTVIQPLHTFETKIAVHNKNNETILKEKLKAFSDKLKQVEKKVQDASWMVQNQTTKAKQEQGKLIEEMSKIQREMSQLRNQLEQSDQKRKQTIQSNAARLDELVEDMLTQTKKLQIRVEELKKGYEVETQRMKKNIK